MAKLLFRDAQGRDGAVDLGGEPVYVGRAVECAIRTDDAMVSRKHSMVRFDQGRYWVEDLGSSNGTHVNDVKVQRQSLNHNDVVRCGSLWLRYIEDVPLQAPVQHMQQPQQPPPHMQQPQHPPPHMHAQQPMAPPQPMAAAPAQPSRKGGTMRLDAGEAAAGFASTVAAMGPQSLAGARNPVHPVVARPQPPQPPPIPGYGQPPGLGNQPTPGNMAAQPQHHAPHPHGTPSQPPPLPPATGMGGARTRAPHEPSSVVVDMGDSTNVANFPPEELMKLQKEAEDARAQLEDMRTQRDREAADNKRYKAEHATLAARIEDAKKLVAERDEMVLAHGRVSEELRAELKQQKDEIAKLRGELGEAQEDMVARDRQLARAHEDVAKVKKETEEVKRQLAELSKIKDEGWKKLNEQLAEVEHLREVIREQERILEERRVGLITQEEATKELRADKEARLKEMAQIKVERDELKATEGRRHAQVQAVEEENRRLARLLSELEGGGGGAGADKDEFMRMTGELKDLRVELKKQEAERERVAETMARAEKRAEKAEADVARLDVERAHAMEAQKTAEAAKSRSEEARGRAEVGKQKAEDERKAAGDAREKALAANDEMHRELDRMQKRLKELEAAAASAAVQPAAAAAPAADQEAHKRVHDLQMANENLARRMRALSGELDAAKAEVDKLRAAAQAAPAPAEGAGNAIKEKAGEVYQAVNDVMSELRMNILVARDEFAALPGPGNEVAQDEKGRTIREAIEAAVAQTEDIKGVLRGLRELVES